MPAFKTCFDTNLSGGYAAPRRYSAFCMRSEVRRKGTRKMKHIRIILLLLAGVFLFIPGCKKQTEEIHAVSSVSDNTGTTLENDTLIFAGIPVTAINPLLQEDDGLSGLIFSGLLTYDSKGNLVPDLAESYSFDEETLTYTFQIREGVTWQDGELCTAEDVAYTYSLLSQDEMLESDMEDHYQDIASIKVTGPYTVKIKLSAYHAGALQDFTIGILPMHLLEGENISSTDFNRYPIGTGPYRFVSWDTSTGKITLEKNEAYYGTLPGIQNIVYLTVETEEERSRLLEAKEADLALLSPVEAESFRNRTGFVNYDIDSSKYLSLRMNFASAFWQKNSDSIKILNYAVDKSAIVKNILKGHGTTAVSPVQKLLALPDDGNEFTSTYNLEAFASGMEALGWKRGEDGIYTRGGEPFSFQVFVDTKDSVCMDAAKMMALQLKSAGIQMQISNTAASSDTDLIYDGYITQQAVAGTLDDLYSQYHSDGSANSTAYANERIDTILTAARREQDPEKRQKIYQNFAKSYSKNPGEVLLAYVEDTYVAADGLKGISSQRILGHDSTDIFWNVTGWSIIKKEELS